MNADVDSSWSNQSLIQFLGMAGSIDTLARVIAYASLDPIYTYFVVMHRIRPSWADTPREQKEMKFMSDSIGRKWFCEERFTYRQ